MKLFLGLLGDLLAIKDDEGRTSSLTIEFLHEYAGLGDFTVTIEELDDVHGLDLVGQASHDERSLLIVGSDILGKLDSLPIVESASRSDSKTEKVRFNLKILCVPINSISHEMPFGTKPMSNS